MQTVFRSPLVKLLMRLAIAAVLLTLLLAACAGSLVNALVPADGYRLAPDLAYGPDPRQRLDVYAPAADLSGAPVVVFFHGGSWQKGDKADYRFVGEALSGRGMVAVVAEYRIHPQVKFPAFIEDGARAVRWAREHAREYGGDPARLYLMGHSAGAHIAAMLALNGEYLAAVGGSREWLAGMVGLSGPYDFLPLKSRALQTIFGPPERYPLSQPVNFVDGRNPPMLLLHGDNDRTVRARNTRSLEARLRERGGAVQTLYYPHMGHARMIAVLAAPLRFAGPVLDDITPFLRGERSVTAQAAP